MYNALYPKLCDNLKGSGDEGGNGGSSGCGGGGGTHVYLWPIHVDVWQNHHNIVK